MDFDEPRGPRRLHSGVLPEVQPFCKVTERGGNVQDLPLLGGAAPTRGPPRAVAAAGGVGLSYCARQQQQQAGKTRLAIAKLALLQFTSIGVAFLLRGLLEAKGNEPKRDQEPNELKNQAQEKPRTEDQERERKLLRIGG